MSLIKFRVYWSEDTSTFRDIEILSSQSYFDLHTIIKKELLLPDTMEASFFVSNEYWRKEREISSTVEKNLRDAVALSMKKTSIGALLIDPHQKFVYECVHPKAWLFWVDLITLMPDPEKLSNYPTCIKREGISPSQLGIIPTEKDAVMEVEERYDLNKEDDGFGDEGEEEQAEESDEMGAEEFGTEDF